MVNVALEETDEIDTDGSNCKYDSSPKDLHVVIESRNERSDDLTAVKRAANGQLEINQLQSYAPMAIEGLLNLGARATAVANKAGPGRKAPGWGTKQGASLERK